MTISRRLMILLAVPLVALLGLGIFTRLQLSKIEARSRFVSESRVLGLATLGNLSRGFEELRIAVRSHVLSRDAKGQADAQSVFDKNEEAVSRLLRDYENGLISDDHDRQLLNDYRSMSRSWIVEARQVMSLSAQGRFDEALALLNSSLAKIGAPLLEVSNDWIEYNENLATAAGDVAIAAIEESRWKMLVGNSSALLLTALLGFITFRRIVNPVRALESTVKAISSGDYSQEVPFTDALDETGSLARSIDVLKQGAMAIEEQRWVKSQTSRITGELQGAGTLEEFGNRLLEGFMPLLGGGVAGFYVFDETYGCLRRYAAYGLAKDALAKDSFALGEGLVGQCAKMRETVLLDHLPTDYLQISCGLGAAPPLVAVAIPLVSADTFLGALEIASFSTFSSRVKALYQEMLPVVAMSLQILQRNLHTQELLAQTQEQARQLEEQTEELSQSQEELLAQQEELLTQRNELTDQREQLKASEERSRLILESSAEGIFGVDEEGTIVFVNRTACQMLGFTTEELVGQPSHAIIHHHRPDGSLYPIEECLMYAAYKSGKASRIDDEFLWRKDGSGLAVEYGATPMVKDGHLIGAVISFTDITVRKQQESALKTQHSALEAAANAIVITDRNGSILWVNQAFTHLTGYEREEAIGLNPRVLKSGVHEPEFYADLWRTVLGGSVWHNTLTNRRKDGSLYQEEMTITPVRSKQGDITHFVAVKQDITERMRVEQRIRETEQFFRSVLELAPDGMMVVDTDGIILANEQIEKMFGYTRDELVGQPVEMLVPIMPVSPKGAQGEGNRCESSLCEIKTSCELQGVRKDGSLFPVEIGQSPLPTRQGHSEQAAISIRDISERKRAEQSLAASERRTRRILETCNEGFWLIDNDVRTVEVNDAMCQILDRTRFEILGQTIFAFTDEENTLIFKENVAKRARGEVGAYEIALLRPDGSPVPCRVNATPLLDENGVKQGAFAMFTNITDQKKAEEDLRAAMARAEEATEMKSMFLANMSHEIRTPMNAIIGLSHLALKTPLNPKQRDYISKVHNAGTALLAIINDILDFSKIEAGKLDIEVTDFQIDEVIGSVTTVTAQKAHEKGLEFLADVASDIPERLRGDPLRLGQIITNLVNNAVKFTERGEIRLKIELLEQTGDKVQLRFSVRDSGIGMTRDQAARLFQPFSQADMSTTRKHGGTGLGLTICKRLVELMGGHIWLESEPGVGSTFTFTIWLEAGQSAGSGRMVPEEFQHLHVLVVDDNAAAREILVESLESLAERVDAVSSGPESIAAIRERDGDSPYDVVFMDWRMPGMDGLQAIRLVKNDSNLHKQPAFIIVTAFGREEIRDEAESLHVEGFLVKPVTKSMLVDSLVNVLTPASSDESTLVTESRGENERLRGMRILLTEDNEINQQIAIELLEGVGASVDVANHGREAVEKLLQVPFPPPYDVVLMDLQMPEMDGYQATAKIRSDNRLNDLPIIAMTAHATVEERQRCLSAGMNDHVSKPIDPAQLYDTLARFYKPPLQIVSSPQTESQPVAVAQVKESDIPVVEGLDTKDGLLRVAGNRKLYMKLLRQFIDQQGPAVQQIHEALSKDDTSVAERLAHTVKGVAGSLGAGSVQQVAAKVEKAIASKTPYPDVKPLLDDLESILTRLVSRLRDALPNEQKASASTASAFNPEQARPLVQEIMTHLNNFDPAASDCLEAHRSVFQALLGEEAFTAFENEVAAFSFVDALARMEKAAHEKGLLPV